MGGKKKKSGTKASTAQSSSAATQATATTPKSEDHTSSQSPTVPPNADLKEQDDDQQAQEEQQKGFKGMAKKDMQHVTGYVAEREGEDIDQAQLDKAMSFVNEQFTKLKSQKTQKQKVSEKISVSKEDIDLIVSEMEVTKAVADRCLKENQGNVVATLKAMVNG
ncbi:6092_t:CDS:2 [Paraglomus brasilianum]|uniref:6092_t:CDS:1 n=1 Tax=Paraglomus brasilianum TaxID=144538 RepID=A0A9N8VQI5_9GLOM|nr:6092_t:CDS:2 [Paraglomus brasilianum]